MDCTLITRASALQLSIAKVQQPVKREYQRWDFQQADWQLFCAQVEALSSAVEHDCNTAALDPDPQQAVDVMATAIAGMFNTAAGVSIRKRTVRHKILNAGGTSTLTSLFSSSDSTAPNKEIFVTELQLTKRRRRCVPGMAATSAKSSGNTGSANASKSELVVKSIVEIRSFAQASHAGQRIRRADGTLPDSQQESLELLPEHFASV